MLTDRAASALPGAPGRPTLAQLPGAGWPAWAALPLTLALVTVAGRAAGVNATTAGFAYLLLVLGFSTWSGWAVGIAASVGATFCLNYFFLPPVGGLTIAEPANWVALGAFLVSSALVSRLVSLAREQAAEAERRRREVETLYDLCFSLFAVSQRSGVLGEAAARTLAAIGAESGGLLVDDEHGTFEWASRVGEVLPELDEPRARQALAGGHLLETAAVIGGDGSSRTVYLPLSAGGRFNGVLVAREVAASRAVLEPAARLLALAIERERLLAEAAHLEAARQSEQLKTSLLRAVSHDLRTPLTAMRLSVESLGRQLAGQPQAAASLETLAREEQRLSRRIDNLLAFARLEAGVALPHRTSIPAASLVAAARESLASVFAGRRLEVAIEPGCPELDVDPSLTLEILVNLLENAARASAAGEPIAVTAERDPENPGVVRLEVLDRGPGMPASVKSLWRASGFGRRASDGEAADSAPGGLGLAIANAFAEAHGGALALLDRPGGGTIARLTLPAVSEPDEEAP